MARPEIHVLQDWPAAMSAQLAALYLDVSVSQFRNFVSQYPDRLRAFTLVPKGDKKWSREQLDGFLEFRRMEQAG